MYATAFAAQNARRVQARTSCRPSQRRPYSSSEPRPCPVAPKRRNKACAYEPGAPRHDASASRMDFSRARRSSGGSTRSRASPASISSDASFGPANQKWVKVDSTVALKSTPVGQRVGSARCSTRCVIPPWTTLSSARPTRKTIPQTNGSSDSSQMTGTRATCDYRRLA